MGNNTFAKFLKDARQTSGARERAILTELGLRSGTVLYNWETGISFPSEDRLPTIARIYEVDQNLLRQKFEESKAARNEEKRIRHSLKHPRKPKFQRENDCWQYPMQSISRG